MLRARMGIRAHPTLTSRKTSKGHHGTQSCGCAGQTVRPSPHSISQTSVGESCLTVRYSTFQFARIIGGQVKPLPRSHLRPRLRHKGGVGRNGETARAAVNDGAQAPP